jgi:hypothetical protein
VHFGGYGLDGGGCTSPKALYVHIPDKVNSPGLMEAREVRLDAAVQPQSSNDNGSGSGYALDAAFAPINHLGIIASYRNNNNFKRNDSYSAGWPLSASFPEKSTLNGSSTDIGAGYFTRDGLRGKFEVYAGAGYGDIANSSTYPDPGRYSGRYTRCFVQAGYGLSCKYLAFMAGARVLYKKFNTFQVDSGALIDAYQINQIRSQPFVLMQPYGEIQTGYKYIRLTLQLGFQIGQTPDPYPGPDNEYSAGQRYRYTTSPFYGSMGIAFQFAPRFMHRKGEPPTDEDWFFEPQPMR